MTKEGVASLPFANLETSGVDAMRDDAVQLST